MTKKNAATPRGECIPCQFKSVGTGGKHRRIGFEIKKANLPVAKAEKLLCAAQLDVQLIADPNAGDDAVGQGTLIEDGLAELQAIAVCNRYSSAADTGPGGLITGSLHFEKSALEDGALDPLAYMPGRLIAIRIGSAPKDHPAAKDSKDGDEDD